jgi:colicin import membrane protein
VTGGASPLAAAATDLEASERAERSRIQQARERANAEHGAAAVECYQRFAVNQCLMEARDKRNAQLADLKRQEVSLNDAQRKRRGAEQVQRTVERTSPERQEQLAQRRGQALAQDAKRQQRHSERSAPAPQTRELKTRSYTAPKPSNTNTAAKQERARQKMLARQSKLQEVAQAKAKTAEREKEAAEHRDNVLSRQAKSKKPPSATLPIPPGAN